MSDDQDLLQAALKCREAAYAPYSGFKVGAALRAASGAVFSGCNVENASFPVGLCAEATAIAAMAAAGERRICDILIVGGKPGKTAPPCGACRQRILEFSDRTTRVLVASPAGVEAVYGCEELLPHSFALRPHAAANHEIEHDRND